MTDERSCLIVFTPSGKRGRFVPGTPVLQAARKLGVDIDSVCGGRGICGRCQVLVAEGEFAKHGITSRSDHLTAFSEPEQRYAAKSELKEGRRLSCHARIENDVVIDVPADSQVHHQVVRKEFEAHDIELDPVTRLYYIEVQKPDLGDARGDLERVGAALSEQWQLDDIRCDFAALKDLQDLLRKDAWQITVAVRNERDIVAVWAGYKENLYGIAIDVGSTTIAAHLCDLASGDVEATAGSMNPQIRFGEDLMSRVSYVMQNPGGDKELTRAVRKAINQLIRQVADGAGIQTSDILELTLVGNPVMHHLVLGISPVQLGVAPFALATDSALELNAEGLGLRINAGGHVYVLPCIAGHVGADAAAVMLAEAPYADEKISLIIDVGTNAEILLGNNQRMLAASSPTGPAFEGAQISCGQRAAPGAIERVRIDPGSLEPKFKVIGCDLWSDEDGFQEGIAGIGVTGICGSGIIEVLAQMFLAGLLNQDGVIIGDLAARTSRIIADGRTASYVLHEGEPDVVIRQNDVRAIQLAKAALHAGAQLLMDEFGVEHVDTIRLAGAFGSHIDVKYAMVLGMIPDCDLTRVSPAGNAASTGARIALLNKAARKDIEERIRLVEKIETAVAPAFQQHFVEAMAIPHKTDPFENLAREVSLPARTVANTNDLRRKRSRRKRLARP